MKNVEENSSLWQTSERTAFEDIEKYVQRAASGFVETR